MPHQIFIAEICKHFTWNRIGVLTGDNSQKVSNKLCYECLGNSWKTFEFLLFFMDTVLSSQQSVSTLNKNVKFN